MLFHFSEGAWPRAFSKLSIDDTNIFNEVLWLLLILRFIFLSWFFILKLSPLKFQSSWNNLLRWKGLPLRDVAWKFRIFSCFQKHFLSLNSPDIKIPKFSFIAPLLIRFYSSWSSQAGVTSIVRLIFFIWTSNLFSFTLHENILINTHSNFLSLLTCSNVCHSLLL